MACASAFDTITRLDSSYDVQKMAGVKMSSLTILSFVLSFVIYVSATDTVPVLLWQSYSGSSLSTHSSALKSLSSTELSTILLKKISDSKPLVLVFAEKALSVEDFTWIGSEGERPFTKLENAYSSAKSRLYMPDVNSPMTALLNLKEHDYTLENIKMGEEIAPGSKSIVVINLDTERPGESRLQMFQRHDDYITSVCSQMSSKAPNSKILAVYTGENFSWKSSDHSGQSVHRSRVRRAVEKAERGDFTFLNSTSVYLYSPSSLELAFTTGEKKSINLTNVVGSPTSGIRKNGDIQKLTAKFSVPDDQAKYAVLTFQFQKSDGMWNLTQVSLQYKDEQEDMLIPDSQIGAPLGFSYHCSRTETFTGKSAVLRLLNPQIQPYAGNGTFRFGPTSDCVYFFTITIISGLLLTVLLLSITSWGIAMIMGIHTMDRFDDPKGKALFINAVE